MWRATFWCVKQRLLLGVFGIMGTLACEAPLGLHDEEPLDSERLEPLRIEPKAVPVSAPSLDEGKQDDARQAAIELARDFGMIGFLAEGSGLGAKGATRLDGGIGDSSASRGESVFVEARLDPTSTFAADVDTASYANVRRFLREGRLPPGEAVRIEEMLNYFSYDYPEPGEGEAFAVHMETALAPWAEGHQVLRVGINTPRIDDDAVPARNLVFLLDVSGSMQSPDRLGLVTRGLELLVNQLRIEDRVAIVAYAGESGVVLPPTSGGEPEKIREALISLRAGGSTNGASGLRLAYQLARQSFQRGAINRVILATDGDFNVGLSSEAALQELIEEQREFGVFLTVLGVGRGNLRDSLMEALADKGNGNYAYLDSLREAEKVLVKEAGATLYTVAKDVKFQLEFDPLIVKSHRLIGYENRRLAANDFEDDQKDAGELGAGHQVTALYEIIPHQLEAVELGTLKIRYKSPETNVSQALEVKVPGGLECSAQPNPDMQLALGLAQFGMLLSDSKYRGGSSYKSAGRAVLAGNSGEKERLELLELIEQAERLSDKQ